MILKLGHYGYDLANKNWDIIIKEVWDKLQEIIDHLNAEKECPQCKALGNVYPDVEKDVIIDGEMKVVEKGGKKFYWCRDGGTVHLINTATHTCIDCFKALHELEKGERCLCDSCEEFCRATSGNRTKCPLYKGKPSAVSEDSLLTLIDGVRPIVELWNAESPAQKEWKRAWLEDSAHAIAERIR